MAPIHFVPAHNHRHRSAVFALYRTLLRLSRQVTIPSQRPQGLSNPVSQRIRCRLNANRSCWSNRLVYAALAAGYQFIDVLTKARDTSSPEYTRLLQHFQSHPLPSSRARRTKPPRHAPSSTPQPGLLTPITQRDGTVKYIPTIPPQEDPRWAKGRLPQMAKTAEDTPFLRMRKPQAASLTKKLVKKRAIHQRNVDIIKRIEIDDMTSARDEDYWEWILTRQMSLEGSSWTCETDDLEASYRWGVALSKVWLDWRWERRQRDAAARGDALAALTDAVRDMRMGKTAAEGTAHHEGRLLRGNPDRRLPSNVRIAPNVKVFPLSSAVQRLGTKVPDAQEIDPFIEPCWSLLAHDQHKRLRSAIPPLPDTPAA